MPIFELKGIKEKLGELKIDFKPDEKQVMHRPYRLNPRVKEKVKKEIDKIMVFGLIFPVDEVEWMSPIIIHDRKIPKSINNACVHDPFLTPFSDEVLNNVSRNEAYSFVDGFSGYH